jgi:hypothetical protein
LALGRKATKGEASAGVTLFIGEGEREETIHVPQVGDDWPTAHRSDGDAARIGFTSPRSLTGGPQSAFEEWRKPKPVFGPHSS